MKEINRILKDKGLLVITGKADFYNPFDFLALKAEKNAYLKGFPNRFTKLSRLISQIDFFGLKIIDIFTFPNRGDFGLLNYKRENLLKLKVGEEISGYEYLMIAQKISNVADDLIKKRTSFDQNYSKTAQTIARIAGFASIKDYFKYIGIDKKFKIINNRNLNEIEEMLSELLSSKFCLEMPDDFGGGWIYSWHCFDVKVIML